MPQTPCAQVMFQLNTPVYASLKNIPVNLVTSYRVPNTGRPFVPFVACTKDVFGVFKPDTVANNKAFVGMFIEFWYQVRNASIKYMNGTPSSCTIEDAVENRFASYLAKKTLEPVPMFDRYLQVIGIVQNFWANADPTWTDDVYNNELSGLFNKIVEQADKTLYCPNAQYHFSDTDPFTITWDLYAIAEPNIAGFLAVEFYQ